MTNARLGLNQPQNWRTNGEPPSSSYYRARYYDPANARFLSEDPILFHGGVNFYAYVGGNPLRFRDPLGLDATSVGVSFVNGAISGAAGAVIVGGLAVGAVTLGAPIAVVTAVLGAAAVVSAPVLGLDMYCNIKNHNWNGLAFNIGSVAGSSLAGGLGGRALAEGINGVSSPAWSWQSDGAQHFDPSMGPSEWGPKIWGWLNTGPNPGSAGGSAALGGAGAATAAHGICGCN